MVFNKTFYDDGKVLESMLAKLPTPVAIKNVKCCQCG